MGSNSNVLPYLIKYLLPLLLTVCTESNAICIEDIDCDTKWSVCEKSTCVCPPGYITNSDKTSCLPESTGYGGGCEDNVQCSAILGAGGECINGICQCATKFHYLRGQCIRSTGLGEPCRDDDHCFSNYDFESTSCTNGTCQCTNGYYQREYSACRKISYAPGDPCGIAQDCHFKDAVCTMARICDYKNTTQPTPPSIVEPFVEEEKHLEYHKLMHLHNKLSSVGEINIKVGENCSAPEDCSPLEHSYCSSIKKCLCVPGYYSSNSSDACYPELGSPCESDTSCKGRNTMCRNSTQWCACLPGFVASPDNRQCLKMSRFIGWSCLHDEQCSFFGMGGICVSKKCACMDGTHFDRAQLFCWRSQKIGQTCLSKEDCSGEGEECRNGSCMCSSGYHAADNNTGCRRDALFPGDICVENTDCTFKHSICQKHICQCDTGYFNKTNKCVTGIGGSCRKDHDCIATNSKCINNSCKCIKGSVASNDNSECLTTVKSYGDNCVETVQCFEAFGNRSVCRNSRCNCLNDSHFVFEDNSESGRCYLSVKLGEFCTEGAQCIEYDKNNSTMKSPRSVCRKGICSCKFQYSCDFTNNICTGKGVANYRTSFALFSIIIGLNLII